MKIHRFASSFRLLSNSHRWCIAFRRSEKNRGAAATSPAPTEKIPLRGWLGDRLKPAHQLFLSLLLLNAPVHAVIIGTDSFDYADGSISGKNGGQLWNWKNQNPAGYTAGTSDWDTSTAASVSGGKLVTNGTSAEREYNGPGEGLPITTDEGLGAISAFNNGTLNFAHKVVYYKVTFTTGATLPTTFALVSSDFGTDSVALGKLAGAGDLFAINDLRTAGALPSAAVTMTANTTYTVVAKLDFGNGTTGTASLFVNPTLGAVEPAPSVTRTFNSTFWSSRLKLTSTGGAITWDDLVVYTAWGDLAPIVVTTNEDEDDGFLGGSEGVSLREAVKYSPAGSLITFDPSLIGQTITLTHADGYMLIPLAITIDATGLPGGLTLSGNNTHRHFDVLTGKNLTLRGLTLTRGNGSGSFGGSIVSGGTLNLVRCTLSGNTSSIDGGAVYSGGTLRATDCTFSENLSGGVGGGIDVVSGTAELTRCTLSGNTGSDGGALWQQGSTTATLSHCTITGNRSTGASTTGGIFSNSGILTLQHCTISQNTGNGGGGGGLYLQSPATVNVANSIIAGNADPGGTRPDIFFFADGPTLTPTGTNLIGNNTSAESQFPATANLIGTAAAPVNAKLSPLGHFGGPVQTMHPLIGSPAIDAAGTTNPGGTDARGFPRFVDGTTNTGTQTNVRLDIGAVEAGPLRTVAFATDAGSTGALRGRISQSTEPGARIGFLAGVNFPSQTITLNGTQLDIPATANGLFIDASDLSAPVTISGNNASRVFNIASGATVAMHSLRIVNGRILSGESGGGINNEGCLTIIQSALAGNSADFGGAILNNGDLSLSQCSLTGNSAVVFGGAIFNNGLATGATLTQCTLSGNSAADSGGAIENGERMTLRHCTLSGNSAADSGGAIKNRVGGILTLTDSIAAANTALTGPDIHAVFPSIFTTTGVNLLSSLSGSGLTAGPSVLVNANPLLAPLGDYGGPTQTMPPLPASPAIDAAAVSSALADQRGLPRSRDGDGNGSALPDIGAVEASLIAVTTVEDANAGSLRAALTEAAAQPGADTVYFTAAVTPHITLASEIVITDPDGVTLDASDRPAGLVIDGGTDTNRHFRIESGATATFHRLRLYGGGGTGGGTPADYGGSIYNSGTLTLRECMFMDNSSANIAGAIYNQDGLLTIERSTFANNTARGIGAILQESVQPMTITASTFTNNVGRFEGGALSIANFRPATLTHCTISGNAVTQTGGNGGGGILTASGAGNLLTLRDCIVSGNTDANFPGVPNVATGFTSLGNNVIGGDAKLAALGDYGGPTWSMPPVAGSAAIDAATSSTATTDQRGVGRPLDGDDSGSTIRDIGAVEVHDPTIVGTPVDELDASSSSGAGYSLREAIRDAPAGSTILFDSSFNGESGDTITLSQTLGEITFTKGLIVDASANTGGVTIDGGPGTNRIFQTPSGTGAFLKRLTLTGGAGGDGGAIYNEGTLGLTYCTISGNTSNRGGGIFNYFGTLMLDRCLLTGNTASEGGAIFNQTSSLTLPAISAATLTNCTLTSNTASSIGGAFFNFNGRATLLHCTLTGNTAQASQGSGVASYGDTRTRTTVQNCVIAGNTSPGDVSFFAAPINSFVSLGGNVIGSGNSSEDGNALTAFNQPGDIINQTAATARLAPLADYGGPTHTIALRPGSPALSNATPSRISTDQRGFPIVIGTKDSGAYEAGNYFLESYNVFAQEFLPPTATDPERAPTFDLDGDGATNEAEWLAVTNAADPNSRFTASLSTEMGDLNISFPTITGRTYRLEQSSTLLANSWADSGLPAKTGDGSVQNFIVTPATGPARLFFRVVVSQP